MQILYEIRKIFTYEFQFNLFYFKITVLLSEQWNRNCEFAIILSYKFSNFLFTSYKLYSREDILVLRCISPSTSYYLCCNVGDAREFCRILRRCYSRICCICINTPTTQQVLVHQFQECTVNFDIRANGSIIKLLSENIIHVLQSRKF